MLVMLDAIHGRFGDVDAPSAWSLLIDPEARPISFHVLEIAKMGLTEDLYVKMNSRGKPLTEFEHFKALFEQRIEETHGHRSHELAERIDQIFARACAKRPESRFQTAREMLAALQAPLSVELT